MQLIFLNLKPEFKIGVTVCRAWGTLKIFKAFAKFVFLSNELHPQFLPAKVQGHRFNSD